MNSGQNLDTATDSLVITLIDNNRAKYWLAAINIWVFFLVLSAGFLLYYYFMVRALLEPNSARLSFGIVLAIALGIPVCILTHELIHLCAMIVLGARNIAVNVSWKHISIADTGKSYPKGAFLFITVAPFVFLSPLFVLLAFFIPKWFWLFLVLAAVNTSGSVYDLFYAIKIVLLPTNSFIQDLGDGRIIVSYSDSTF